MVIKRAIVLAAGKGTRLGLLTQKTPKPLIDLGGVTPLERVITSLEKAGVEDVIINCSYLADQIIEKVYTWQHENKFKCKLIISHEDEPLETAGGIKKVLHHFKDEPFIIANADIVWQGDLASFVKTLTDHYNAEKMDFLLALTPNQYSPKTGGDFKIQADGQIRFLDKDETSNYSYCGLSISHPCAFANIGAGFTPLRTVWDLAIDAEMFYGFSASYAWIDMGTPAGLEKARNVVKSEQGTSAKVLQFAR
ncbi:MAG: MurNAc alpha-1-phosphate uridylyltransferase [Alphaproteobacteria bacterium]|jgi:MurNAc alpha-1-phosphate uridylyltransferase